MRTCPVCYNPAEVLDALDFNKSCNGAMQPSGNMVDYYLCQCGFCFCHEISGWDKAAFLHFIYNDDYALVDPDYLLARPRANADFLAQLFGIYGKRIRHLDYGGGNGQMVRMLKSQAWKSTSYDPFANKDLSPESLGKFDLITAFEVFEHVPDPQVLMKSLAELLQPDGVILFSTLLSDGQIHPGGKLDWWYAAPRNGHISLYSRNSLCLLAQQHGFNLASRDAGLHLMYTTLPAWAAPLIKNGAA